MKILVKTHHFEGSRPATVPISIRRPIFLGHPPRSPWENGVTLQLCTPFSGGFQRKDSMGISYLVSQLGNPKNRLMASRKFQNFIDELKMEIGNYYEKLIYFNVCIRIRIQREGSKIMKMPDFLTLKVKIHD